MRNANTIVITMFLITSLVCFATYLYLTNYTDISDVELKSGKFAISNNSQILSVPHLRKGYNYNLILRFYREADIDISNLINEKSEFKVQTELVDNSQKQINLTIYDNIKQPPGSYTNEYFEWHLTSFNYNNAIASAKLTFTGSAKFFDSMKKEIFIENSYDPAARPFLILVKKALLYVSILLLIIGGSLWILKSGVIRGRRQNQQGSALDTRQ